MELTYWGNVVVFGPDAATSPVAAPQGEVDGLEFNGEAVIRHSSGAYIRFSPEGDIVLMPAPGRRGYLGNVQVQ